MDELRRGALHFLPVRVGFNDRAKKKSNNEHARVVGERRIYGS
jgi:hypothetical protein